MLFISHILFRIAIRHFPLYPIFIICGKNTLNKFFNLVSSRHIRTWQYINSSFINTSYMFFISQGYLDSFSEDILPSYHILSPSSSCRLCRLDQTIPLWVIYRSGYFFTWILCFSLRLHILRFGLNSYILDYYLIDHKFLPVRDLTWRKRKNLLLDASLQHISNSYIKHADLRILKVKRRTKWIKGNW